MAKYEVRLDHNEYGWGGKVIKRRKPSTVNPVTISTDESVIRVSKGAAIMDIDDKLNRQNVDYQNDEVTWYKTGQRISSRAELQIEIDKVD